MSASRWRREHRWQQRFDSPVAGVVTVLVLVLGACSLASTRVLPEGGAPRVAASRTLADETDAGDERPDAGEPSDAGDGRPDVGDELPDAGDPPDAEPTPDEPDAGASPDAGEPPGPEEPIITRASSRCPPEMAHVAAGNFCIDRWEAHVLTGSPEAPSIHPGNIGVRRLQHYWAASAKGVVPQAYISGREAQQACASAGKRLCGRSEWKRACQGSQRTTFPYGISRQAEACHDSRRHPFIELYSYVSPSLFDQVHLNDPRIDLLPMTVLAAGSKPACVSEHGVFDMVGNVHEWVDDPEGTFVGGYFVEASLHGAGCLYVTTAHAIDYHDYSTGFRCCRDATVAP